jgi:hypothetical protein
MIWYFYYDSFQPTWLKENPHWLIERHTLKREGYRPQRCVAIARLLTALQEIALKQSHWQEKQRINAIIKLGI